jgi:hypothetical protein
MVTVAPGGAGFGEIVTSKDCAEIAAASAATTNGRRKIDMTRIYRIIVGAVSLRAETGRKDATSTRHL